MNKANLKSYAPQARQDFIAAVSARASILGITAKGNSPTEVRGDVALIDGREWPKKVVGQRSALIERIELYGFQQVIEEVAYTWFNRFAALRFMEIHDYLDHGWRVLSSRDNGLPELLGHASELSLGGLSQAKAQEMQLAGNQDNELYKLLLVAQCNALSSAMPFLFERIDDQTELLLPDNLLRTDSIIAKLVAGVPEEDWQEIEIIGWLYQFYISEKKDQVIGKVVKSEDIPAATQLFTPNWIVQYLVQNSVGRLWLMANPQSTLAKEWPYYITPAEQTPEVQAQLDALIQTRVREDGDTLNPESITVLDPACGSGHILVVAYDVLKAIYLERGYQPRAIPRLILEKNLYGLDIDDRAAQMAGFALLMKARADDRRLFTATDDAGNLQPPKLNVLSMQESKGLSVDELATHLTPFKVQRATITSLVEIFEHAKTFGSLIQIPFTLKTHLTELQKALTLVKQSGDMYARTAADDLMPLVQQAQMLSLQFDAVVANPPYIGRRKGMNELLKSFVSHGFSEGQTDLFAAFIIRCSLFGKVNANIGMMSPNVWMYLSSFEELRELILSKRNLTSLVELPLSGFTGATVQICSFVFSNFASSGLACFVKLIDCPGSESAMAVFASDAIKNRQALRFLEVDCRRFNAIPGKPIAYWLNKNLLNVFGGNSFSSSFDIRQGLASGDNDRFFRFWWEVSAFNSSFELETINMIREHGKKWVPLNKGGAFRRWYGNREYVVAFDKTSRDQLKELGNHLPSEEYYLRPSVSWSDVTSFKSSFRNFDSGFIFNNKGNSIFFSNESERKAILAYTNSKVLETVLAAVNPTLTLSVGALAVLPGPPNAAYKCEAEVDRCVEISKIDWDYYERSWNFKSPPFLFSLADSKSTLESSYQVWMTNSKDTVAELQRLEKINNQLFIEVFKLIDDLDPSTPIEEITLTANPAYRYGGKMSSDDLWERFRRDSMGELVSYAIGCMMGRYSLDESGLIYAHAGNVGFDPTRYATFPADADGIVPITDDLWFAEDAPNRIREFLRAVWGPDTLEENMTWLAESLGTKATETPDEAIRRYISDKFFKDHVQTYKKRPIYWHFSSGKQGAFQALVYLHRYNEGTLARMRSEYVVPLTSKFAYRLDMLEKDASASSSTAARTKIQKQIESLRKKQTELMAFEEKLRHYADMRIKLDLDDGVKVNYAKFGDLLAESKAITGGADE